MVKSGVDIAHGLGSRICRRRLRDGPVKEYGIDYAQGYYIGRPRCITSALAARAPALTAPIAKS